MKILWVNSNFLHPTTKGGQIRTLEMLRQMHKRHEIHYVAFHNPQEPEGPARASEYSTRSYAIPAPTVRDKNSPLFAMDLAAGLFSPLPVAIRRYYSPELARLLQQDLLRSNFDKVVCDFLSPAPHFPDHSRLILFQHNVETMIWRRRVEQAGNPVSRAYLALQARRMFAYERQVCQDCAYVLAVSENDATLMRDLFAVRNVSAVPTGVDIDYFAPPSQPAQVAELAFVGSMDWMPNIDGMRWFIEEILPRIRARQPHCRLAIIGRSPTREMEMLARRDPLLQLTGTVPDIRPFLWGSTLSVVPLRIGGGTRLKIYESMAAQVPVVSTTIGAEGLPLRDGEHLYLADDPDTFATRCLTLLDDQARRRQMADTAWQFVAGSFSWDAVARQFEALLAQAPDWRAPMK